MKGEEHTWHVTAVHGKQPMKVPNMQSVKETPQTPQAILMPDQGTTPINRNMESLTQGADLVLESSSLVGSEESPASAFRVISSARGNMYDKKGARGAARRVAHSEPMVVRAVSMMVANAGEKRAPASTF